MSYSTVGIVALLVLLIINRDTLYGKKYVSLEIPAVKDYRLFLISVAVFFVTDILWGVFDEYKMTTALFIDTSLFFVLMMASVYMWTRYVIAYLNSNGFFAKGLTVIGVLFLIIEIAMIIANCFWPIVFYIDDKGGYHAGNVRYLTYSVQILLFLMTTIYTIYAMTKSVDSAKRRNRTIAWFGIAMIIAITAQLFFPLDPMYSLGYLLGTCVLHVFVVEDEKEEYSRTLENTLLREQEQLKALGSARRMIYTDPLTGARSKQAYMDDELNMERRIKEDLVTDLAVIVFDVNDLKLVNDTKGHDAGDMHILSACMMIGEFFPQSPVYRIGGDEFIVILEGEDYLHRASLLHSFDAQIEENLRCGRVVVSSGLSDYDPETDKSYRSVFERADKRMYARKRKLKEISAALQRNSHATT